jgi:hypothetical protein
MGRGWRIQHRDPSPFACGIRENLLDHDGTPNLDHPKHHQEKHGRNDGEFDGSRALSISSASSAIPL